MNVRPIFWILLIISFFTLLTVNSVSADSGAFTLNSSGELELNVYGFDLDTTDNENVHFYIYKDTYPGTTHPAGVAQSGTYNFTLRDLINLNYSSTTCNFQATTITCNLNNFLGTPTTGNYWASLQADQNGLRIEEWYNFNYNGTQWTPQTVFPLTGVSRILTETPTGGLVLTEGQQFTTTIENATPNITNACIVIQRVDDVASYNPITHCEIPNTSGVFTFSTTTDLTYEASYLIKTELYTTSTTTPYITGIIRNVTAGAYLWSAVTTDLANEGAPTMDDFCQAYEDNTPAFYICKITYSFFTIPTTVMNGIYTYIFGKIQTLPPVSWYIQIKNTVDQMQYTTNTQEGIELQLGFNQQLIILDPLQMDTWTGGYLDELRFITTASLYILYLAYLINRFLYRMI